MAETSTTDHYQTVAVPSTTPAVVLPNWGDATSVTSWLVSTATLVIGILTMLGVTVPGGTSTQVSTWAGIAGIAIAAGFTVANFVRVTVLHKAAITVGHPVAIKPTRGTLIP